MLLARLLPIDHAEGLASLSADEQARARSMDAAKRQRQFVAGRRLARTLIGEAFGAEAASLPIDATQDGQPRIAQIPHCHLSISHSGRYVACALSDHPVGINVECCKSHRDYASLAHATCSEQEVRWLASFPTDEFALRYLGLWTLKEAWLKHDGRPLDIAAMRSLTWREVSPSEANAVTRHATQENIAISVVSNALPGALLDLGTADWIDWRSTMTKEEV